MKRKHKRSIALSALVPIFCCSIGISSSIAETYPLKMEWVDTEPTDGSEDADLLYRMVGTTAIAQLSQGNEEQLLKQSGYPEIVKKEPEKFKFENPLRGTVQLGDNKIAFAFDSENLFEKGYHLLYLDLNGNGDLTDDQIFEAEPLSQNYSSGYVRRTYSRITLPVKMAGNQDYDYSFFIQVYSRVNQYSKVFRYAGARMRSAAYRSGNIELAGKKHKIVVQDFDSNGRFDSKVQLHSTSSRPGIASQVYTRGGDMILIDPEQNIPNTPIYNAIGRRERQPLADLLQIDGRFYQVSITPSGDKITLTPSKVTTGFITNKNPNFMAMVYNTETLELVKVQDSIEGKALIPAGKWKLAEYLLLNSPGNKHEGATYIYARAKSDYPEVEVKPGETLKMKFGSPFHSEIMVSRVSFDRNINEKQARLSLDIQGSMGASVRDIRIKGQRPTAPKFAIATPQGKLVERGDFKYG